MKILRSHSGRSAAEGGSSQGVSSGARAPSSALRLVSWAVCSPNKLPCLRLLQYPDLFVMPFVMSLLSFYVIAFRLFLQCFFPALSLSPVYHCFRPFPSIEFPHILFLITFYFSSSYIYFRLCFFTSSSSPASLVCRPIILSRSSSGLCMRPGNNASLFAARCLHPAIKFFAKI